MSSVRRILRAACWAVALTCLMAAALLIQRDHAAEQAYNEVSRQVREASPTDSTVGGSIRDWDALHAINPACAGWLTVSRTPIDYPVVQASAEKPDTWWLSHDLWGNPSSAGSLVLDERCDPDGETLVIYGHRMGWSARMFSALGDAVQQEGFGALGATTWQTPKSGVATFKPLCARIVDEADAAFQQLPGTRDELRSFALAQASAAHARSSGWQAQAAQANRLLTLVTCDSTSAQTRGRIAVLCTDAPSDADYSMVDVSDATVSSAASLPASAPSPPAAWISSSELSDELLPFVAFTDSWRSSSLATRSERTDAGVDPTTPTAYAAPNPSARASAAPTRYATQCSLKKVNTHAPPFAPSRFMLAGSAQKRCMIGPA